METSGIIFILERLHMAHGIPIHLYDANSSLLYGIGLSQNPKSNPLIADKKLCYSLQQLQSDERNPVLSQEASITYAIQKLNNSSLLIWGPVVLGDISANELHDYRKKHNIQNKEFVLPKSLSLKLFNALSLAEYIFNGREVDEGMLSKQCYLHGSETEKLKEKEYITYMMDNSENDIYRMNYSWERTFLDAVKNGQPEMLMQLTSADIYSQYGTLAENRYKHLEYSFVNAASLATRAAIEGGVSPFTAYAVCDLYLQKLAKCTSPLGMQEVATNIILDLIERVKLSQKEKNTADYIEKCKNYIAQHFNQKISVQSIADHLHINCSYLSKRFSDSEGITIQQYILREKTKAAANMLKFSDNSISSIAEYLNFSSQSNFGRAFTKIYGISPGAYRQKYQVVDFT